MTWWEHCKATVWRTEGIWDIEIKRHTHRITVPTDVYSTVDHNWLLNEYMMTKLLNHKGALYLLSFSCFIVFFAFECSFLSLSQDIFGPQSCLRGICTLTSWFSFSLCVLLCLQSWMYGCWWLLLGTCLKVTWCITSKNVYYSCLLMWHFPGHSKFNT